MDEKLLKKLLESGSLDDPVTTQIVLADLLSPGSTSLNQLAHNRLDLEIFAQSLTQRLFSRTCEQADGPILLGYAVEDEGKRLGLFPLEITCLILLVGTPKSGKTTTVRVILVQLLDCCGGMIPETKIVVLDSKLDTVALYRQFPRIIVIPWRSLCFNPLQVPLGVDPKEWCDRLVDIFCGVYFIGDFGYHILLEAINQLYEQYGVYQGKLSYPSIRDLRAFLARKTKSSDPFRQREALSSLLNRLDGLLTTFGQGLDYSKGMCVPELISGHFILTTNGLPTQHSGFLTSVVLAWTYNYHEAHQLRDDFLRVVFVIDEAEPVLGKDVRKNLGRLPVLFQILPRLREFGIGLIVANQSPRGLDDRTVLSFSQTKILKNLVDAEDIACIGRSIGLKPDQMARCRNLQPNEAVVFISGRQPEPVLIQIPDCPLDKKVDWNDLQRVMEPRIKQVFTLEPSTPPSPPTVPTAIPIALPSPSNNEVMRCLMDVYNRPFLSKADRLANLFGSSASKQQRIAKACLDGGYVTEHEIHAGGRSGVMKLWQITCEGYRLLNLPPRPLPGKGDLAHQYLQYRVSEKVKEWGYKGEIEFCLNGKNVDVGIRTATGLIAIEVATTAGNEVNNVVTDLNAGFHHVAILPTSDSLGKTIERTLKRQVDPTRLANVSIITVSTFLTANTTPW